MDNLSQQSVKMQINVITAGMLEAQWAHMSLFVDNINEKFVISLMYKLMRLWDAAGGQKDAVVGHHGA